MSEETALAGAESAALSDYVIDAANHDAAHRHSEAVDALARGVKAGDVESMTRLGKRLFTGDASPYLPREAVGFFIDAAKAGGAEAAAILAVLSATGAFVQQSWHQGLSALVLAAERGWEPAREQLRVLAADRKLATVTFLAYLNDDYEAGETDFPELGVRHKGTKGEGLYFVNAFPDGKPDMRMVHAGRPPVRGDKWIVSQFVRSRAFVPRGRVAGDQRPDL